MKRQEGPVAGAPVPLLQRAFFFGSALSCAILLLYTFWMEENPLWQQFWESARATAGEIAAAPRNVPQILAPSLGVVDRCTSCHASLEEPDALGAIQPLAAHPGPMLEFHEAESVGCTTCHDGQGRGTVVEAAHGEVKHWDRPLLRGTLVEARCTQCHRASTAPRAPHLRRGAALMERHACYGCHELPGAGERGIVGPEITFTIDRTSALWIYGWLKEPGKLLSKPRMGNFGFSDEERADVVAHLTSFAGRSGIKELDDPSEDANEDELDALYESGRRVFRTARCVSCHAVNGNGGDIGPDLGRIGEKLSLAAIAAWIERPQRFHAGTRMPRYRLSEEDRLALAYYLKEEMRDPDTEDWLLEMEERVETLLKRASKEKGRKLIQQRGCLGCHALEGEEGAKPVGPDLTHFGEKGVERLPFGDRWDSPRTRADWTRAKLEKPRSLIPDLMMPTVTLSDENLDALTIATLGFIEAAPVELRAEPLILQPPNYPAGPVGELMRDLRCLTCHALNGTGGTLAPDLSFVGSRVQRKWMRDYIQIPYAVRPHLVERMPRLGLSDEESELLTDYLDIATRRDGMPAVRASSDDAPTGEKLFAELRCVGCHILGESGGSIGPNLSDLGNRMAPEWILFQLQDPASAGANEPSFSHSPETADSLARFLDEQRAGDRQ